MTQPHSHRLHPAAPSVLEVDRDLAVAETYLHGLAGVNSMHLDRSRGVVHLATAPDWAALLMSASTLLVTTNALPLNRAKITATQN